MKLWHAAHHARFHSMQLKCILKQLFCGLALLQNKKVLHRDLKNANLLLNNKASEVFNSLDWMFFASFILCIHFMYDIDKSGFCCLIAKSCHSEHATSNF